MRSEHTAEHWVTVGAAIANLAKAGDGFQVIRPIASGHGLVLRFGGEVTMVNGE